MHDNMNNQYKHNHTRYKQFYVENPYTNLDDKKLQDIRPLILNSLYEIKIHIFTWMFILKTYPPIPISLSMSWTQHFQCSNGFASTSKRIQVLLTTQNSINEFLKAFGNDKASEG